MPQRVPSVTPASTATEVFDLDAWLDATQSPFTAYEMDEARGIIDRTFASTGALTAQGLQQQIA